MNLTKKLFLIFVILSVLSINTILCNSPAFASINGFFAVTNNFTDFGGGNNGVSNNTILVKPSSLEEEHKEIHEKLEKIVSSSGDTANMSKQVQFIMQPHFEKEEQLSILYLEHYNHMLMEH